MHCVMPTCDDRRFLTIEVWYIFKIVACLWTMLLKFLSKLLEMEKNIIIGFHIIKNVGMLLVVVLSIFLRSGLYEKFTKFLDKMYSSPMTLFDTT